MLFKPIWMKENLNPKQVSAACEKVMKLKDEKLIMAAEKAPCWKVRERAVEHLYDQTVLSRIAQTDSNYHVRSIAVRHLKDQAVLSHVVLTDSNRTVREYAVQRLNDPVCAGSVYLAVKDPVIRQYLLEKVTDPSILTIVALNRDRSRTDWEQRYALNALNDADTAMSVLLDPQNKDDIRRACFQLLGSREREAAESLLGLWESGECIDTKMMDIVIRNTSRERLQAAVEKRIENAGADRAKWLDNSDVYRFVSKISDRTVLLHLCAVYAGSLGKNLLDRLNPDTEELFALARRIRTPDMWESIISKLVKLKDERVNACLIERLYERGANDFQCEAWRVHDIAIYHLIQRTKMSEAEIAVRYGGEDAVRYYLREIGMRNREASISKETFILKALYNAGIGRELLTGRILQKHDDYSLPSCDGGGHIDKPDVIFSI